LTHLNRGRSAAGDFDQLLFCGARSPGTFAKRGVQRLASDATFLGRTYCGQEEKEEGCCQWQEKGRQEVVRQGLAGDLH
jgi:hypothetical protein